MIASPISYQSHPKKASLLRKYLTQPSLAILMFIALAVVASVGKKPADKREPGLRTHVGISQSVDQQRSLSLNPKQLLERLVVKVKDAFNDPALIEYANEQGADVPDSLTGPCPNTSQRASVISKFRSDQSSKPSFGY